MPLGVLQRDSSEGGASPYTQAKPYTHFTWCMEGTLASEEIPEMYLECPTSLGANRNFLNCGLE